MQPIARHGDSVAATGRRRDIGMSKTLVRLVYRSRSLVAPEDKVTVKNIFEVSRRNNKLDHITGCLAQPDGHFVQVVEGRGAAIDNLMGRISADPRHEDIVILGRWFTPGRLFDGWAMLMPDTTPLKAQSFRIIDETGTGAQVISVLLELTKRPESLYDFV